MTVRVATVAKFRVATLSLAGIGAVVLAAAASCADQGGGPISPSTPSVTVVVPPGGEPSAAPPASTTDPESTSAVQQNQSAVPDGALVELARAEGPISVIVTLDIPYHQVGVLTSAEAEQQRADIVTVQDELAASIPQATATARMTDFPQIVFRVNEEALHHLAASPLVLTIELNESTGPTG